MRLGVRAALVDGALVQGDVEIEGGRIARVGCRPAAASGLAAPGFVDLHVNGFAGIDFLAADLDGYRRAATARAATALAATGVVAFQPTFVSSPPERYSAALAVAARARDELLGFPLARPIGVHLEGPFLSPRWAGAHETGLLRRPEPRLADRLCRDRPVTMVTLAPELTGGLELVERLAARGIVVSIGHSDADAATAAAAFDRGARALTHIHNAHRRWRPRDPGLAGAALVDARVHVHAIVDNTHIAPETAYATLLATRRRFCLVTDAVAAAQAEPGEHRLGSRTVVASQGGARLPDGTLAGSVVGMDQAVRNLVASGARLEDALGAASAAPARLLRLPELGSIAPGCPARVAVLDDELVLRRTVIDGREAFAAEA